MRAMLVKKLHSSHLGVEGCLRRAREVMYWPGMNQEVKDVVSVCSTCNAYRPEQCKEPLLPHDIPSRPWSRVGIDLFQLYDQHYLVTVDYFSNFFEVDKLSTTSATQVITKLRIHFARYGVPDVVVSDNGPQFACEEFKQFATRWQFSHVTSSPRYPQSNGKVENAVKTAKQLMRKAIDDKADVYLAFLDYRNTPTEAMHTSPAQRMFARRTRTLLPMLPVLLQTEPAAQREAPGQLKSRKNKQARLYNRQSKKLATLQPGDVVRFKKPTATNNTRKWTLAKVRKLSGIRSYIVESDGATYRRNRRQLRSTPEHYDDDAGGDSRQQ